MKPLKQRPFPRQIGRIFSPGRQTFLLGTLLALVAPWGPPPIAAPADAPGCAARLAAEPEKAPVASHPRRPSFALRFGEDVSPYPLITTSLLPEAEIELDVVLSEPTPAAYVACADLGTLVESGPGRWRYRAPAAGEVATLGVLEPVSGEMRRLRVLVLTPYDGRETLEGYRVGSYRRRPLRGLTVYRPPSGLFRVDADDVELPLSPHFRLGQFLSKQQSGFPKFVLVSSRLLLKLEGLIEAFNEAGIEASTLAVMSAFRTPYYNQKIGNTTRYSRHLFGDAADIYVDEDGDGRMDDLDGDGRIDVGDARLLAAQVERLRDRAWYAPLIGGLGIYGPAPHRGPFIHIDTRGSLARWSSS